MQVHQLLQMLKQDPDADSAYSGEGSNTDSGRGPSEEGEGPRNHNDSQHTGRSPAFSVHGELSFYIWFMLFNCPPKRIRQFVINGRSSHYEIDNRAHLIDQLTVHFESNKDSSWLVYGNG